VSENVSARPRGASRRAVVGGVVGLGVGVPLVAACGGDEGGDAGGSGGTGTTASGVIGKTSEVPVGGGKIFQADKVVVTQPTEGDFKAFSAVCTHQGCVVAEIKGENIDCTCHGSQFSIVDGSNTRGPNDSPAGSVKPLPELKVTVKGGEISVA
jgi:nitrite reductase/ring-hydroxylating ferredoxin subunit